MLRILPSIQRSVFLADSMPVSTKSESECLTPPAGLKGSKKWSVLSWLLRVFSKAVSKLSGLCCDTIDVQHLPVLFSEPPALVRKGPLSYFGKIGDNITISCGYAKEPSTEIHWYKNGQLLTMPTASQGGGCYRRQMLEDGSLSISCAQDDDCGVYHCTANNGFFNESSLRAPICFLGTPHFD